MITHPEKIMFPEDGITKGELASYYEAIAPVFFQKDVSKGFPDWLERVEVPKHGGTVHHPIANDKRSVCRVKWEELESGEVGPKTFTLRTMAHRISTTGDLWADMLKKKRSLNGPITRLKKLTSGSALNQRKSAAFFFAGLLPESAFLMEVITRFRVLSNR